jgi:hypothetical protein
MGRRNKSKRSFARAIAAIIVLRFAKIAEKVQIKPDPSRSMTDFSFQDANIGHNVSLTAG